MPNKAEIRSLLTEAMVTYDNRTRDAEILDAEDPSFVKTVEAYKAVMAACERVRAQSLEIEAQAKCRLAAAYDLARERGEIPKRGVTADLGIIPKQIHEARKVRDAEKLEPGIVATAIANASAQGKEPTRAYVARAINGVLNREPNRKPNKGKSNPRQNRKQATHTEAEPEIKREDLSLSAQQKLDRAIRQHTRKLDMAFEERLRAETRRHLEETVLPNYEERYAEAQQIVRSRKGIMKRAEYNAIRSCLHPDRIAFADNPELTARFGEAFRLFNGLQLIFLNEKEDPRRNDFVFPKSYAEAMAMKAKVSEERKAKRREAKQARETRTYELA